MANKKITILFALLLLGGSFLQSCSDEDEKITNTNPTTPSGCYILEEVIDDGVEIETITYTYNSSNQITAATSVFQGGQPSTTTFEYDGQKIITATDLDNIYEFDYSGNNTIPSRISIKEGTNYNGYYVIQSSGQNITEFEEYELTDDGEVLMSSSSFEYDNKGNVTKAVIKEEGDLGTELTITFEGSVYDGKRNPYNTNFVFFFMADGDPFRIGSENLVSGNLSIEGSPEGLPFAASYEYNDEDYPTSISSTIPGLFSETKTITYDCK